MTDPRALRHVFSVDGETDGLWGPAWAIAVEVFDEEGAVVDQFSGRVSDLSDLKDEWVVKNIVPLCLELPTYSSRRSLRDAFWAFWLKWREKAIAVADCGSSVEAGLFRACVEDDLKAREWLAPFPLYDLGTLLYLCNINPQAFKEGEEASRIKLAGLEGKGFNLHNPVHDAYASGKCWLQFSRHVQDETV